jgi:hypothetical protein
MDRQHDLQAGLRAMPLPGRPHTTFARKAWRALVIRVLDAMISVIDAAQRRSPLARITFGRFWEVRVHAQRVDVLFVGGEVGAGARTSRDAFGRMIDDLEALLKEQRVEAVLARNSTLETRFAVRPRRPDTFHVELSGVWGHLTIKRCQLQELIDGYRAFEEKEAALSGAKPEGA